jgi:metallo-beta-lactamase family protein
MSWLGHFKTPPKKTFIVHGETDAQEVLRDRIRLELGWNVEIPSQGQQFELT